LQNYPTAIDTSKRLQGIDLLRGLAIFFVLMNHVNMRLLIAKVPYTKALPAQLVHALVWNGEQGVQIFFVVSGFLIASISLHRWSPLSQIKIRDFYVLRFARIAPLFFLLLAVLCGLHFAHIHNYVVTARTGGLGRAFLAALTLRINVLEARTWYLPGNWDILWSLSVEEMFYLFFPLVSRVLGRSKLFVGILLAFVALGPFGRTVFTHGNPIWRDYSYLGGMEGIALGCLTALLVSQRRFFRPALLVLGCGGAAIVIGSLVFSWQTSQDWLGRAGLNMTVLGIGTCMAIAAAAQTQWKAPRIARPLLKMGEYSYEIYLTHMFVVFALFDSFVAAGKPMCWVVPPFIAVLLLAAVFGAFVARLYSEPMNRLIRSRWLHHAAAPALSVDAEAVLAGENSATA
jgi:peptidoglycan/LPS O-acetylase OafA/YrhL